MTADDTGGNGGEAAACPHTVHVRDSKHRQGPQPALGPEAWSGFLAYAARG